MGKSRLVDELGAWCAHQGAVVAQGRSYPTEGGLGFGLVISWLAAGCVSACVAALTLMWPSWPSCFPARPGHRAPAGGDG